MNRAGRESAGTARRFYPQRRPTVGERPESRLRQSVLNLGPPENPENRQNLGNPANPGNLGNSENLENPVLADRQAAAPRSPRATDRRRAPRRARSSAPAPCHAAPE